MLKNIFTKMNSKNKKRAISKRALALILTLPLTLAVACNRESHITELSKDAMQNTSISSMSKSENSKIIDKNSNKKDSDLLLQTSENKDNQSSSSTTSTVQIELSNSTLANTSTSASQTNNVNQEIAKQTQEATTTKTTQRTTTTVTSKTTAKPTPTPIPSSTPVPTTTTTSPTTTKKQTLSVSLTISLQSVKNNPNALPAHQQKLLVPESGYLANGYRVEVKEGTTVLEVLKDYLNKNNIHYDIQDHQFGAYIAGINNIYEFDAGKNSGWMYKVNGVLPNYGVGSYTLKDGDSIFLFYTIDYTKEDAF